MKINELVKFEEIDNDIYTFHHMNNVTMDKDDIPKLKSKKRELTLDGVLNSIDNYDKISEINTKLNELESLSDMGVSSMKVMQQVVKIDDSISYSSDSFETNKIEIHKELEEKTFNKLEDLSDKNYEEAKLNGPNFDVEYDIRKISNKIMMASNYIIHKNRISPPNWCVLPYSIYDDLVNITGSDKLNGIKLYKSNKVFDKIILGIFKESPYSSLVVLTNKINESEVADISGNKFNSLLKYKISEIGKDSYINFMKINILF